MGMRPVYLLTSDASGAAISRLCPMNWRKTPFHITIRTVVIGTVNYDVQYTTDDIREAGWTEAAATWTSLTGMAAAVANAEATIISPVTCVRLLQNSGTGSVEAQIISAGG
jgi:hypothetical protein